MSEEKKLSKRIQKLSSTPSKEVVAEIYALDSNDRYWSIQEIAKYIGMSETTVRRSFINDPRWPKPIARGKYASQRWLASEVRAALLLFRE